MKENIIQQKSFDFSIAVVETYKTLIYQRREYILSKQFLRSGTSIGANISEAIFEAKMINPKSKDFFM